MGILGGRFLIFRNAGHHQAAPKEDGYDSDTEERSVPEICRQNKRSGLTKCFMSEWHEDIRGEILLKSVRRNQRMR